MKSRVLQAIRERRLLRFSYEKGRDLTVAPCILGQTMTGYAAVLCWQPGPADQEGTNWRLLDLDKIRRAEVLEQHFGPPPRRQELTGMEFSSIEAVI